MSVEHSRRHSTYSHRATDVNELAEFVADLYAVGAVGDERVKVQGDWTLRVDVRSEDLMPAHGHGPVRLRYCEWRSLHRQIGWLWVSTIVFGIATILLAAVEVLG